MTASELKSQEPPTQWQEYEQLVGLYRFYLDLALRVSTGVWLIAGGVLTLVLANSDSSGIVWALSIPILAALFLACGTLWNLPRALELSRSIENLATKKLHLAQRTHAEILVGTYVGLIAIGVVLALTLALVWRGLLI